MKPNVVIESPLEGTTCNNSGIPSFITITQEYVERFLTGDIDQDQDTLATDPRFNALGYKVGRGGNHIWISAHNNKRLAIIYYQA